MKRVDLIKKLNAMGCVLVRHGGRHDWYRNPASGVSQPVPRHREVDEATARHINQDADESRRAAFGLSITPVQSRNAPCRRAGSGAFRSTSTHPTDLRS